MTENVVAVKVDPMYRSQDAAVRAVLADELRIGTVRYCYGEPTVISLDDIQHADRPDAEPVLRPA